MITETATRTGREYLRVSQDESGYERSNDDQHDENTDVVADFGITLGEPYRDVGSASRLATKERLGFTRLMRDLKEDTFGADVLILWENSRGSRQPREWLDLIDVCKLRDVKIFVTNERRLYDLTQWRDSHHLQAESLKAAASSEETSERVIRTLNSNAKKGKPHGLCPYGYLRTYVRVHNTKNRLVTRPEAQLPNPAEALNVIDLFTKLRDGQSFKAIAADWAARKIVSRDGVAFSAQSLSQMARKVSYVGRRTRTKTVKDPETGKIRKVFLEEVDGGWPVVADFEGSPVTADEFTTLFHEVQDMLKNPDRRTNPGGGAKHEWTMTIRCDVCSGPIAVTKHLSRDDDQVYTCHSKGCVRLNKKAELDDLLTRVVLGYLARPDVYEPESEDDDAELRAVRVQLTLKRNALAETEAAEPESLAEERRFAKRATRLEDEIKELEEQARSLTRTSPVRDLAPGDDMAARWAATAIPVRRAIAAELLSADGPLGEVRIRRLADSPSDAVQDRITWVRTEGGA